MEKKLIRIFYPLMLLIVATCFSACSTTPKATKDKTIEIVVHRGANHLAPENTIPSAMAALENGADWVEVDAEAKTAYYIICMMKTWNVPPTGKVLFLKLHPKLSIHWMQVAGSARNSREHPYPPLPRCWMP